MEQKTPLYERHLQANGRMVEFGGFLLPVQYETGVVAEHMAVRTAAGLFDVSHMGEFFLEGPDALENLQRLLTNDYASLQIGRVRYSPMCNERGGVVDDLIVYRMGENRYMIVVNAANRQKDASWFRAHLSGDAVFSDESDRYALLALQGPCAREILAGLCGNGDIPQKYYSFIEGRVAGAQCIISRTGYTGEHGYELYCAPDDAPALWDRLLEAGRDAGLIPCGLGARDTLRLEAAMPLYGHEMDDEISPLEAGLDFAVKLKKEFFIGRDALLAAGEPQRRRIGLRVTGRGIAREQCDVYIGGEKRGHTTSGTFCPYLKSAVAMALIEAPVPEAGAQAEIAVRGRRIPAEVAELPFYTNAV